MDIERLRSLLRPLIVGLSDHTTHTTMPNMRRNLGLPEPGSGVSKRELLSSSFDAVADAEIPKIAEALLTQYPPSSEQRNLIQDLLWKGNGIPEIPKKSRHTIARVLGDHPLYRDGEKFDALLDGLWVLDDDSLAGMLNGTPSLRNEIDRHVHRNPGDWDAEELFRRLGAFEASDARFARFLEGITSADVNPDDTAQRALVEKMNSVLQGCGVELSETGIEGGYPVFKMLPTNSRVKSRPKNLIFASNAKPDLRFSDAVSNDVEIVTNADKVLVYDRMIGEEGITWQMLQTWWADKEGITDSKTAKTTLYTRLRSCLPSGSPPQSFLYEAYHKAFGALIPDLPALLPEVWLHWDPRSKSARGPNALERCRMDFLMLFPNWVRVVIEVDGKHHYANSHGVADVRLYSSMVAADRDLKLAGYHVYRFGAEELLRPNSQELVTEFFNRLFLRFGVKTRSHKAPLADYR